MTPVPIQPRDFTIAEQWQAFSILAMPVTAGDTQRQEMRRSFYCGFEAAMRVYETLAAGTLTEQAAIAIMDGLRDECDRFGKLLQEGKA